MAIDFTSGITGSIMKYLSKKAFYVEEPGQETRFALDQSSRSLALLSRTNV
jgi:hypothetical protein